MHSSSCDSFLQKDDGPVRTGRRQTGVRAESTWDSAGEGLPGPSQPTGRGASTTFLEITCWLNFFTTDVSFFVFEDGYSQHPETEKAFSQTRVGLRLCKSQVCVIPFCRNPSLQITFPGFHYIHFFCHICVFVQTHQIDDNKCTLYCTNG